MKEHHWEYVGSSSAYGDESEYKCQACESVVRIHGFWKEVMIENRHDEIHVTMSRDCDVASTYNMMNS
jgi:hypothetical protein